MPHQRSLTAICLLGLTLLLACVDEPVDPPEFLDHEGAELLLVGAEEDASDELGVQLDTARSRLTSAFPCARADW